jgi:hypothetical protein
MSAVHASGYDSQPLSVKSAITSQSWTRLPEFPHPLFALGEAAGVLVASTPLAPVFVVVWSGRGGMSIKSESSSEPEQGPFGQVQGRGREAVPIATIHSKR